MPVSEEVKLIISAKDNATRALNSVTSAIKGVIGAYLGFRIIKEAIDAIRSSIAESSKAEIATTRLTSALDQMGITSAKIKKDLIDYASSLQNVTIYSDEQVLVVESLLARLGVAPQYLKDATKASLDFASAMGIDIDSAAKAVGKSYSGNTALLQRYGIQVDSAKIKSEGFGVVIDSLNQKFGGAAEAMGETFQGRLIIIGNLISDVKEKIGDAITQNVAWKEILGFVTEKLQILNKWLIENKEQIKKWATSAAMSFVNMADFAIPSLLNLGQAILAVGTVIPSLIEFLYKLDKAFGIAPQWEKDLAESAGNIREELINMGGTLGMARTEAIKLAGELRDRLNKALRETGKEIKIAADGAGDTGGGVDKLTDAFKKLDQEAKGKPGELHKVYLGQKALQKQTEETTKTWKDYAKTFGMTTGQLLTNFTSEMVDVFVYGQRSMSEFVRDFMRDIMAMIVKALILKAIMKSLSPATLATNILGFLFQHGGSVPGGAPFRDRVPALLTPGEYVLPRNAVQNIGLGNLESMRRGGSGGTFNISIAMNSSGNPRYDARMLGSSLENEIKELIRRRKI